MRHRQDPKFQKRVDKAIKRCNIFDLLATLDIKYKQQSFGDLWLRCFLSVHQGGKRASLHVTANPSSEYHGIWKCFGCGGRGNIVEFVKIYRDIKFMEALVIVEAHQREETEESVNPVIKKLPHIPILFQSPKVESEWEKPYLDYLYGRGIEWWQIQKHGIGYTGSGLYDNRVIVPVTLGKEFCTFVARSILDEKEFPDFQRVTSSKNGLIGLFGSNYADIHEPAVICEGWADKLAIERLGYKNVYSAQTNTLYERQMKFIKPFPYMIVIPDGDDGGNSFVDSLAPYIEDFKIFVARIPWGKDPAKCNGEEIESAIAGAKLWMPSKVVMKVEIDY